MTLFMTATTPKARIAKGKALENWVAEQIADKGLDVRAKRAFGSGNGTTEKADVYTSLQILGQNVGIECKHVDSISLPDFWRQTQKLEKLSREPLLVIKQTGWRYEATGVFMYLDTLLELLKEIKVQESIRKNLLK